jgi:hypothetical protein
MVIWLIILPMLGSFCMIESAAFFDLNSHYEDQTSPWHKASLEWAASKKIPPENFKRHGRRCAWASAWIFAISIGGAYLFW